VGTEGAAIETVEGSKDGQFSSKTLDLLGKPSLKDHNFD
jgi:hypothetical protein